MTTGDEAETLRFWLGSRTVTAPAQRRRVDRSDFGGADDVGLNLRRIGRQNVTDFGPDDFGVFLGRHDDSFVVAVKDFWTWKPTTCEIFSSLAELKQFWELD